MASMASAHSDHATTAGHRRVRAGRAGGLTAIMVLAARCPPSSTAPLPGVGDHSPASPTSAGERYEPIRSQDRASTADQHDGGQPAAQAVPNAPATAAATSSSGVTGKRPAVHARAGSTAAVRLPCGRTYRPTQPAARAIPPPARLPAGRGAPGTARSSRSAAGLATSVVWVARSTSRACAGGSAGGNGGSADR
jgi:hypothetical protein